jgi:hypothetical protein
MDLLITEGPMEEMMVEEPTNEEVMVHTGLRNDIIEDMRERIHRVHRLIPRNPVEIGDDLP